MTIEELTKVSCEEYYASDEALKRGSDEAWKRESDEASECEEFDLFEDMSRDFCDNEPKWFAEDFIDGLSTIRPEDEDEWISREFD
jgi:hypothetical protein